MLEHLDKTKDLAVKGEGRHAHHKPAQEKLFCEGGISNPDLSGYLK